MDKHPHLSHSRSSSGHRAEHSDPFVWRKVEEDLIGRSANLAAVVRGLDMRRNEALALKCDIWISWDFFISWAIWASWT